MRRVLVGCACVLALFCAEKKDKYPWSNPFDPNGTNYYPPEVKAMKDTVVGIKTTIKLRVTGSSPVNRKIVKYLWSFDKGTTWSIESDTGKLVRYFPKESAGKNSIWAMVVDEIGLKSKPDSFIVDVHFYNPAVQIMNDTAVPIRDTIKITAQATDTNGRITAFFWAPDGANFTDTTIITDRDTAVKSFIKTMYPDSGRRIILVKVEDNDTLFSAIDTLRLEVKLFRPVVKITQDTAVPVNDTFTVRAQGYDSNGVVKKYLWTRDGVTYTDTTTEDSIKVSYADSGTHTIGVKVIDDDDLVSDPAVLNLQVKLYRPVVTIMNDTSVAINDTFTVTAQGYDTNGVIKKYLWAVDGSTYKDTTTVNHITVMYPDSGARFIGVKVIDDDGFVSDPDIMTLTVKLYRPVVKIMPDTTVQMNATVLITAQAWDTNGTVVTYLWALDGSNFKDSTSAGSITTIFKDTGTKVVKVKVIDDDKLVSDPDSTHCFILTAPPILTHVNDTTVSQTKSVLIKVTAVDTNNGGKIEKYYWDKNNDGWDDSTDAAEYTFAKADGGKLRVRWGARDNDKNISTDTFTITFNFKPTDVTMTAPVNNSTAVFESFNKLTGKGVVMLSFKGTDPDGPQDTLRYTLQLGKDQSNLTTVYTGKDTSFRSENMDTSTNYFWKLTASDPYDGSVENTGKFKTPYVDVVPPKITIKGSNPIKVPLCSQYIDSGATALDNKDGDISNKIKVFGVDSVNTWVVDTYTVTYTVADSMGNSDTARRVVIIESYIVFENFENGPENQSTFGALFGAVNSDSIGCWSAWTDKQIGLNTHFDPDPYADPSAPFKNIVLSGVGSDNTKGLSVIVYVDADTRHYYKLGFNLKSKNVYYNLSGVDSITFNAKGDDVSANIRVQFTDPHIDSMTVQQRWGYVGKEITINQTWKKFTLLPKDLKGVNGSPGNGKTWDDVKTKIRMMQFANPQGQFYDQAILIDNIKIYGNFKDSGLLQ